MFMTSWIPFFIAVRFMHSITRGEAVESIWKFSQLKLDCLLTLEGDWTELQVWTWSYTSGPGQTRDARSNHIRWLRITNGLFFHTLKDMVGECYACHRHHYRSEVYHRLDLWTTIVDDVHRISSHRPTVKLKFMMRTFVSGRYILCINSNGF